ncbi:RNA-binding domain-containing protein [[Eubacterium] cellulosolvens]
MAPLKVLRLEVSALIHATEDTKKVKHAIKEVLPSHLREVPNLREKDLEGHYRNPIKLINFTLEKSEWATTTLENIINKFSGPTLRSLTVNLNQYLDNEGNLFLRLDKQAAFSGMLRLRQDDAIRIKIKLRRGNTDYTQFKEDIKGILVP